MTCRWHSNCFMQLIEREWIMGVQEPAVLCRALQHHWGWQRALLQLGNDPYLNCSKTRLIATPATHWADHVINCNERRNISLSWGVWMYFGFDWTNILHYCVLSFIKPLFKHIDGKRHDSSFYIGSGWQKIFTQTFQRNQRPKVFN